MRQIRFSIGRILLIIALLQVFAIGITGLGVAAYMNPDSPRFADERMPRHRRANLLRKRIPFFTLLAAFAILILSNILIARWIIPPIKNLRDATRFFGKGDWTRRITNIRSDEFGDLASAFNEMAERIENQMKSERAIIATISHELRTPLTRLRVALELLEDEHPNSGQKLQTMTNDIIEVEQLIDNVFTSARLSNHSEGGSMLVSELRATTSDKILKKAIERFNSRYPDRQIRILNLEEERISVSPMLFRRALENLLENAHKYSDEGTQIDAQVRRNIGSVLFTVTSIGEPIPDGQRMKIFDPFFQMRPTQGTGLGLTLVKRIVEAHKGSAWVACESRKNTFAIEIPIPNPVRSKT